MTTTARLVDETRRFLLSGLNEQRNVLAQPYTAGSGVLVLQFEPNGVSVGCTLSAGLNVFHVMDVNKTAKTVTVLGGEQGSTDVSLPAGTRLWVKPRFTDFDILQAINDDLKDLSSPANGLYVMREVPLTFLSSTVGYEIGADVMSVYEVRYSYSAGFSRGHTPRISPSDYRLARMEDGTTRLQLFMGGQPGQPVAVLVKAAFAPTLNLTDDVAVTTGLHELALDLPPMGAALRLLIGREVRRNFTDSSVDTRRAEEVPPGAVAQSYRGIQQARERRLQDEASRLQAMYPVVM